MKKVFLGNSKIEGIGVIANKNFKKNEKIFLFSDKIIRINHKPGCHCEICRRCINTQKDRWLYPKRNSFGWNLNHSCFPNSYSKGKYIYALKNINANEEITIDYSTTNIDKKWKMKCSCKNKNCRRIIKSIQFLPKDLFKKYKGFMQEFIEQSYNN
jgi:SET domain-containing protein